MSQFFRIRLSEPEIPPEAKSFSKHLMHILKSGYLTTLWIKMFLKCEYFAKFAPFYKEDWNPVKLRDDIPTKNIFHLQVWLDTQPAV